MNNNTGAKIKQMNKMFYKCKVSIIHWFPGTTSISFKAATAFIRHYRYKSGCCQYILVPVAVLESPKPVLLNSIGFPADMPPLGLVVSKKAALDHSAWLPVRPVERPGCGLLKVFIQSTCSQYVNCA